MFLLVGYKLLSRVAILDYGRRVYTILLFLSIFIGLIFFITSSSFLYNKLYVDCQEHKRKYRKLNNIGFDYILLNCKSRVFKWNKRTLDRLNQ